MPRGTQGLLQRQQDIERALNVSQLAGSGLLSTGRVFAVKDPSDSDMADFRNKFPYVDRFATIQAALDECRNGTNDYVFVCPKVNATDASRTWSVGTVLSMNKSNVHLIGVGAVGSPSGKPRLVTTAATGAIIVGSATTYTDVVRGVEIANLHMTHSGNTPTVILNIDSTAPVHGTWVHDCTIAGAVTGTGLVSEVDEDGLDTVYDRCTFGQADTVWLSNHNMCVDIEAGAKRTRFNHCLFLTFADVVGVVFVEVAATPTYCIFDTCRFVNIDTTQALTHGIGGGTAKTVLLLDCLMDGATIAGETSTTRIAPVAQGNSVTAADIFNPGLAADGAEPVGVDT